MVLTSFFLVIGLGTKISGLGNANCDLGLDHTVALTEGRVDEFLLTLTQSYNSVIFVVLQLHIITTNKIIG